jgi:diamine N-acetyltransferase
MHIRNTTLTDIDFVCKLECDPENTPFITQWSKEKHIHSLTNDDILHLILEDTSPVGYVILTGLTNPNKSIELLRITIGPKNKGHVKKAFRIVKELAFTKYEANRLWLNVKVTNARAIHLYTKQGFQLEGTLRECLKVGNTYESLHIMSLLKREYKVDSN